MSYAASKITAVLLLSTQAEYGFQLQRSHENFPFPSRRKKMYICDTHLKAWMDNKRFFFILVFLGPTKEPPIVSNCVGVVSVLRMYFGSIVDFNRVANLKSKKSPLVIYVCPRLSGQT